jgi:hypothetical protein
MAGPVTSLSLFRNLVVSCGYPTPRGGGGHLIRPLALNEWIGVASSDGSAAGRPYYTNDNWTTVSLTDTFVESTSANLISGMLRDGTQVLIGTAESTAPPTNGFASMERSTDTGQSYTNVQDISDSEEPPGTPSSGNFRAYAIAKLSDGTYVAGCGGGGTEPAWWTSPTGLVWSKQTAFVTYDAIGEFWPVTTVMAFLEGSSNRLIALTRGSLGSSAARRIYTIESLGTGAVAFTSLGNAAFNGLGGLFQAASGTIFAVENGVWRSTDNGTSWALISGTSTVTRGPVAEIGGTLCVTGAVGTAIAVYFSVDDGVTWAAINSSVVGTGYECHVGFDDKFYVSGNIGTSAGGDSEAIILSTNVINTTDPTLNPVANVGTGRMVAAFPQADGTVVTFYSTDEGATWTQGATIPDLRTAATPPTSKLRSPSDGQLLFGLKGDAASSPQIARSLNSGVSWSSVLALSDDNVINNFVVMDEPATTADLSPSAPPINPHFTADNEHMSVPVGVSDNTIFFIVNNIGVDMTLVNDGDAPLVIIGTGLVLSKANANISGHYLGWTLRGEDPPYRIETVEMEAAPSRTWDPSP